MGKITQLQVWIIGLVLSIISGVLIFFLLIKPANDETQSANQRIETARPTAAQEEQKKRDLVKAKQDVVKAERGWDLIDRTIMPDINVTNLYRGMRQLWNEQLKVLGPRTEKFLRADKSVQIVSANIQLPPPPTDPNAVNRKAFVYDLGTVTVMGNFEEITRHVERWNKFDRLVLADGLTLQGNSPRLFGTYTLRLFIFPHGTDKPGPAIPQAGGGQGGGMGGMGMGGMGMGSMDMGGMSGPGMMAPGGMSGPPSMSGPGMMAPGDMGGAPPMDGPGAMSGPGGGAPIQ
jgi:hypothetical protein